MSDIMLVCKYTKYIEARFANLFLKIFNEARALFEKEIEAPDLFWYAP